jgi:hypothetical protein
MLLPSIGWIRSPCKKESNQPIRLLRFPRASILVAGGQAAVDSVDRALSTNPMGIHQGDRYRKQR